MFEAARTFVIRTLYERLVLPPLIAYVGRDTAHTIVVAASTYVVMSLAHLLVYWFYRLTLRVADDCSRTLYVGALLMFLFRIVLPLFDVDVDVVRRQPAAPPSSWWWSTSDET